PILRFQILEQTIRHERTIARESRDDLIGGQPYGGGSAGLDDQSIGRFENDNAGVDKSVAGLNRRGSIRRCYVTAGIDDRSKQVFFRHSSGDPGQVRSQGSRARVTSLTGSFFENSFPSSRVSLGPVDEFQHTPAVDDLAA